MAAFCRYWQIAPSEYWRLTMRELRVMSEFAEDDIRRRERESKKARARSGRRAAVRRRR